MVFLAIRLVFSCVSIMSVAVVSLIPLRHSVKLGAKCGVVKVSEIVEREMVVDWRVEAILLLGLIIERFLTIRVLEITLYQTSEKWIRVFKIYLSIRDTFRVQS